jgi:hypothetical protein
MEDAFGSGVMEELQCAQATSLSLMESGGSTAPLMAMDRMYTQQGAFSGMVQYLLSTYDEQELFEISCVQSSK